MISSDLPNSLRQRKRERQEIINLTLQVDKVKSRKGLQLSQGHTTLKWKDRLKRINRSLIPGLVLVRGLPPWQHNKVKKGEKRKMLWWPRYSFKYVVLSLEGRILTEERALDWVRSWKRHDIKWKIWTSRGWVGSCLPLHSPGLLQCPSHHCFSISFLSNFSLVSL